MERIGFSKLLVTARESENCGKNELCRRTGFTFLQLQRLECALNRFNMELPIKYLRAISHILVLTIDNQAYYISTYEDLVYCVKQVRSNRQLTLREVAAKTNITYSYLANVESGKAVISVDIFLKIFEMYNVDITIKKDDK